MPTILTVSLLWTLSGQGVTQIVTVSVMIFSGSIVPLPFFPDWAQPVLSFLPFRGLVDTPFRLYLGHIPPGDLLLALAHQLAWAITLILLGRQRRRSAAI